MTPTRVRAIHRTELAHDVTLDRLRILVVALLVIGRTPMLGRDGQSAPSLSRHAGNQPEQDPGGEADEAKRERDPRGAARRRAGDDSSARSTARV